MSDSRPSPRRPPLPRPTRREFFAASLSLAAAVVIVVVLVALGPARPAPTPAPPTPGAATTAPVEARVTLGSGSPVTVPSSFLGVSTEYWTIPVWARRMDLLDRVLAMLSPDGPIRLRIGGDSADRVQWAPTQELPEWVFEVTPSWLRQRSWSRCSSQRCAVEVTFGAARR